MADEKQNLLDAALGLDAPQSSEETETVTQEPLKTEDENKEEIETEDSDKEEGEEGNESQDKEETVTTEPEKTVTDAPAEIDSDLALLTKEFIPEAEIPDSKTAIQALKTKLSEDREFIEAWKKWDAELLEMYDQQPSVLEFTKAVKDGMHPEVAAAVYISETLTPEEGTEENKKYLDVMKKEKEKTEQRKVKKQEYDENVSSSRQTVSDWVKENKFDERQMEEILKEIDGELVNQSKGIMTKKFLDLVTKGKRFESEVQKLREENKKEIDAAYLRGKNEKIKLTKEKKSESDNLPHLSGSGKGDKDKPRRGMLDAALGM